MKTGVSAVAVLCVGLAFASSAHAQGPRFDVMWARQAPGAVITVDGVLDEPAWKGAEAMLLRYRVNNGDPGSGWQEEGGRLLKDSTHAVFKCVVVGNTLYLGIEVPDSSIGGGKDFNRFDGLLMALKDHSTTDHPKRSAEYFYSWWYPDTCDHSPSAVGKLPDYHGKWGNRTSFCDQRTAAQIAAWSCSTKVHGISNNDAAPDTGYTMEMRIDLAVMGYNVQQANGDVLEFNISIYDCDWFWPLVLARFGSNRSWWQSPWGGDMWYNQVQIHTRPSVAINSGPAPFIGPDIVLHPYTGPNITVNGLLTEPVWATADSFRITWDDNALRDAYPGPVLKHRSGQFQPTVNGGTAQVFNPGDATIKWFTKNDSLFLGFNVRDEYVQNHPLIDRWDGFIVTINHKTERWRDRNLRGRRLTFRVGPTGQAVAEDDLLWLRDTLGGARLAMALKPNTTVDTIGLDVDQGYTVELQIDLTKMGYPPALGDRTLWFGADLLDGDSFTPFTQSYATRTWFAREYEHECCPATVYMQPASGTLDVPIEDTGPRFAILGNQPNPFRSSTLIHYALDRPSRVTLEVFDLSGRRVARRALGFVSKPTSDVTFTDPTLRTGIYLVRLKAVDAASGDVRTSPAAKIMIME